MILTPEIAKIIVVAIALLIFGLLLVLGVSRLRSKEFLIYYFTLYTGLGFLLNLALLMSLMDVATLAGINYNLLVEFALLAQALAFGALTLNFIRKNHQVIMIYGISALVGVILWIVLAANLMNWGSVIGAFFQQIPAGGPSPATLLPTGLGWLGAMATAVGALVVDLRKRRPIQYLNRLRYWLIVTALFAVAGILFFTSPPFFVWAALPLLVGSSVLVSYLVLSYHTPDLKLLLSRAVHYLGVTAILSILMVVGPVFALFMTRVMPEANITSLLFWSAVVAIALAIIFPVIWRMANRLLANLVLRKSYQDQKRVIQHYSQTISSALDLKRLGDTLINLMIETLGIEQSIVFVNDRSESGSITLRPLSSLGKTELSPGHFTIDSPFIDHFRNHAKIVSQYDLEVLPEFRGMSAEEHAWLASLEMELYVPILRQQEFVGLLTFGPHPQGTAYYDEDQDLMIALADQAALAMDSARLFQHLALINQEVGQLTEQLAGLDQNKSDFLSIASHELRTPLTHIHGYSRMLLDLTEEELKDPSYVKTLIEGIAKGSDRMKDVVDMMFDVSEADIGEMNLFLGPVDLEEVVDQAARPFLTAMDQRRIAFAKKGLKDLPAVEADGTRLVQAIENLLSNAIKYTPDGGMVSIEGQSIVVDDIGEAVEILVADNGIGIDPEHHSRIFEKFFRIDDTDHHSTGKTKFKGAGPGLGLTLVKAIAEAHGGRIWVESPGYDENAFPGSKFYFILPVQPVQSETEAPVKVPQKQSQIETRHWRRRDLKQT